jgi:hypothetical protein
LLAKKSSNIAVFHPILFGLYPVLFLVSTNLGEIPLSESWRATATVLLILSILWFILRLSLRNNQKAALITTFLLILFFVYGHLYNYLGQEDVLGGLLGRHRYLIPLFIGTIFLCSWWIIKTHNINPTTQIFNIIGFALVIFPVYQIGFFELRSFSENRTVLENSPYAPSLNTNSSPDIYYIILDAYGRDDILLDLFDYDNSTFLNELHNMGFYVASCSTCNYEKTTMSLASSLNMNYLENLGGDNLQKSNGRVDLVKFKSLINHNEVRRILEAHGYTIVAFQSGFSWSEWDDADYFFSYSNGDNEDILDMIFAPVNQFEAFVMETSGGILFFDLLSKYDIKYEFDSERNQEKANNATRQQIRYNTVSFTLNSLEEIPASIDSPKFVFTHIVSPHKPYVFSPDGKFIPDQTNINPGYIDQITFLNQRILTIVETIIQTSEKPPIIIIQADHGSPETNHTPSRAPILNAYLLPDGGDQNLYPSITPVNSFRLIFDHYFDTHYGLIEDVSRISADGEPFNFTLVPNTCKGDD